MNRKKQIGIQFAVFIGMLAVLWLMLMISACIPNTAIKDNMLDSAMSYKDKEPFAFENGSKWNAVSDNYADAILLNISWNMGRNNPIKSSLDTWYYDGGEFGESAGLYLAVSSDDIRPNEDYSRYWHGTAMFVRTMHLFTDIDGMKICGFVIMLVLALVTIAILLRQRHAELALALFLSMAAVQIWNVRLSLEYQPAFIICFTFCILYMWFEKKSDFNLMVLSVAGGCLIAFFDFLTTETIVFLMPMIIVISVRAAENRLGGFKENMRLLINNGISWGLAYIGTFFVKWSMASIVTGSNKFMTGFSSAGERIAGSLSGEGSDNPFLRIPEAVFANLTMIFGGSNRIEWGRVFIGLAITVLILGSVIYLFYSNNNSTVIKLLGLLGGVVILRYIVLNNHSYLHGFFTYRALISPVMAVLAGAFLNMEIPVRRQKGGGNNV